MIAYSPLHHLIMRDAARPLVMTSANRPGEPLARDGDEARAIFGGSSRCATVAQPADSSSLR